MKTFDIEIRQKDCASISLVNGGIKIIGIKVDDFYFPESLDSDDIAEFLSKEVEDDLRSILNFLKENLKAKGIKFTFTLK